jgi:hypothetical protein
MSASVDRQKLRRSAWILGALAVAFYFGFIAWSALILA